MLRRGSSKFQTFTSTGSSSGALPVAAMEITPR